MAAPVGPGTTPAVAGAPTPGGGFGVFFLIAAIGCGIVFWMTPSVPASQYATGARPHKVSYPKGVHEDAQITLDRPSYLDGSQSATITHTTSSFSVDADIHESADGLGLEHWSLSAPPEVTTSGIWYRGVWAWPPPPAKARCTGPFTLFFDKRFPDRGTGTYAHLPDAEPGHDATSAKCSQVATLTVIIKERQ